MRDDERYPIVVDPPEVTAPEVVNGQHMDSTGRDKILSNDSQDSGMIPMYDEAQKEVAVASKDTASTKAAAAAVGTSGALRGGDVSDTSSTAKTPRRVCGMKKRTFIILIAAVIFVLIGTIVGGTVGGIQASKNNGNNGNGDNGGDGNGDGTGGGNGDNDSESDSDSTPTTTDTGPVPRQTGPIDADDRSLAAASAYDDDDDENVQIFYNDLNTTNILYRRIQDDDGGPEHTLDLDIEPNYGTPLAATCRLAAAIMTTQLFYITTRDNATEIAQVTLDCGNINEDAPDPEEEEEEEDDDDDDDGDTIANPNGGIASCAVTSNSIISSKLTNGVHPESRLAALRLSNDSTRVYFQAGGANLGVLNGDDDSWSAASLVNNVRPGSSIAATSANASSINVFYVANQTQQLRFFEYSTPSGSVDAQFIDETPPSSWSPSAPFAAIGGGSSRLFYANPSSGTIASYIQSDQSWNASSDTSWGNVQSGIASVAWADQVRLLYFQGGGLVVSAQDGSSWEDPAAVV